MNNYPKISEDIIKEKILNYVSRNIEPENPKQQLIQQLKNHQFHLINYQ